MLDVNFLQRRGRLSTSDVPPHRRIRYWEDWAIETCVGLHCRAFDDAGLEAEQTYLDLGGMRMNDIHGNRHVIERSPQLIRRYAQDSMFLCLLVEGSAFAYQGNECVNMAAGDVAIYDANRSYMHGFPTQMHMTVVDLPGDEFRRRCGEWTQTNAMRIDGSVGFGKAISRMLRTKLADILSVDRADFSPMVEDVWQIVETAVHAVQPNSDLRASSVLTLMRAKAYIADHLCDPDLDGERVARAIGVSSRHLRRLFQQEETSLSDLIWQRRLERARGDLLYSQHSRGSIGEIAFRCGFSSQSHFSRAYKQRFGETPQHSVAMAQQG